MKYRLVQKTNPRDPEAANKFYANKVTRSKVELRKLSKDIAEMSTVSIVDIMAVIESMLQLIPRYVIEGDIVTLGDFGSFNLNISSHGSDTEEDFDRSLINGVKLSFRPGLEMKNALNAVTYEKE